MTETPAAPDAGAIERLESAVADHAISGVAPLTPDSEENRVQLKNLIHHVSEAVEGFSDGPVARDLREAMEGAARQAQPVQRPASLCVFTDGGCLETFLLPQAFPPLVLRDTRYYVRPLIESSALQGEFLLLALAQGTVRLYRLRGEEMLPMNLEGLPASLTDVVGHELDGGTLQQHTAGGSRFHGQGKGKDDRDPELERFLKTVDQALLDDRGVREQPLMIAAVEELAGKFRNFSRHGHLLSEQVLASPDRTADEDLRVAALEAHRRWRQRDDEAFLHDLREEHHSRAHGDLAAVIRAAEEGRVDTLLTTRREPLWGRFDAGNWSVERHLERRDHSNDLLDVAMRAVWRNSGHIRIVEHDDALDGPMEARLRY